MKKIIFLVLMIILIPYLVVTFFIKDDEIKFYYSANQNVRVKRELTDEIEERPLEEYVIGVLAGEMPVSFNIEALKAQAVAARSYVMKKIAYNKDNDYDVVDTVQNQVYLDDDYLKSIWKDKYLEKINKIKTAVMETKGEYVTYKGQIIEAFFFSTSTGLTENSEEVFSEQLPYLRSVKSEWDADVSPVFNDSFSFSMLEFYDKLDLKYQNNLVTEVLETTSTGRIKKIKINGTSFTGGQIFSKLGLRSTYFSIFQSGNNITVSTKGYGHGVGMSQYGAQGMAEAGYNYKEILTHYYQGTKIEKI